MSKLWRILTGYVSIKAAIPRLSRFLAMCKNKGIPLYDFCDLGGGKYAFTASYVHHAAVMELLNQCGADGIQQTRRGLLPKVLQLRFRMGLIAGTALVLLLAAGLSPFVWFIRIAGPSDLSMRVTKDLQTMGITPGTPWSKVDMNAINNRLMLSYDDVSYLILSRKGVTLLGEVYPTKEPEPFIDASRTCDIVAERSGVIQTITAYEGTPMVKAGDVVKTGDVLIEGSFFRNEGEEERFVAARGSITARVWYSASASAPITGAVLTPTGNSCMARTLFLGGWQIPLGEGAPYERYRKTLVERTPVVGGFLPCEIITEECKEVVAQTEDATYAEAEAQAVAKARMLALKQVPTGTVLTGETASSALMEGEVTATVYFTAEVPLGTPRYHDEQ
ncbi:MAG: hypothetical protein E7328_06235 [Clostridiales bacterium]|nr:hypothetical protein [Clostridiales bacterium]